MHMTERIPGVQRGPRSRDSGSQCLSPPSTHTPSGQPHSSAWGPQDSSASCGNLDVTLAYQGMPRQRCPSSLCRQWGWGPWQGALVCGQSARLCPTLGVTSVTSPTGLSQQWRLLPYLAAAYALDHFSKSLFLDLVEMQRGLLMNDQSSRQVSVGGVGLCLENDPEPPETSLQPEKGPSSPR